MNRLLTATLAAMLSLALAALGAPPAVHAQDTGVIEGTVVDAGSNGAIPGVNIQLVGSSVGGATGGRRRLPA